MTRNLVEAETADRNRRGPPGGYTFSAFPPDDYAGIVLVVAALRLGDHAHLDVSSGRQVPGPEGGRSSLIRGDAGHLILRWPEWLMLREILDADPRVRIAEVERPTPGQIHTHGADVSRSLLRLAQALRLLRDTTSGYAARVARRALEEAGIPDPPEEDHP